MDFSQRQNGVVIDMYNFFFLFTYRVESVKTASSDRTFGFLFTIIIIHYYSLSLGDVEKRNVHVETFDNARRCARLAKEFSPKKIRANRGECEKILRRFIIGGGKKNEYSVLVLKSLATRVYRGRVFDRFSK